jgi:alpha-N-arabinofuranosidase
MVAETFINFDEGLPRDEAGMTVYQYHDGHADLFLRPSNDKTQVAVKMKLKNVESIIATAVIDGYSAYLRIRSDGDNYWFDYSVDGKNYQTLTSVSCTLLSTEALGGFTGAVIGLYAVENNFSDAYGRSFALFDYFDYLEQ